MGVITKLQVQQRNKERVNVFLDGEYAFSLTLIEAARLRKGQTLEPDEIEVLRRGDAVNKAVDQAARFLGHRPRSIREVRDNLGDKGYDDETIDAAIARLEKLGYVDDAAFARFWLQDRSTFRPKGPVALRHEMRQKGIEDKVIDDVLADFDESSAAHEAAAEKARRLRGLDHLTFRHKLTGFLQRRGFSFETTRDTIARLEDELVQEDPAFFVDDENETNLD